ncbi:MAG: helix-turn-helix transcriptional regulator, partial [Candidatus Accumulibacter sp.]|nr:helix-turn-helix transcriptional regulator [Accumulibacter sp.]
MHSSVGIQLSVWRKSVGLKQEDAAALLGLSSSTYQNYERGTRRPDTDGWQKFARAGINTNWLLTGEGPMLLADHQAVSEIKKASPSVIYALEKEKKTLVINQDQAAYDGVRDILEAVLRVGEYKIANDQVTRAVIEFGLSGAPHWLEAARNYPDLE